MRFSAATFLLAACSASRALADQVAAEATRTVSETPELITPAAGEVDLVDLYENHLDLRQLATDYEQAATAAVTQAPAITTYYINKAIGNTVTYAAVEYTQLFSEVPDQYPLAGSGKIGFGSLTKDGGKKTKRDAAPTAGGTPVVFAQEQVAVTQWVQPMVQIKEVVVVPVAAPAAEPSNESPPDGMPGGGPAVSPLANWNGTSSNQTNITTTVTAAGTATIGTARSIFPSQMSPWQQLPPYDDEY